MLPHRCINELLSQYCNYCFAYDPSEGALTNFSLSAEKNVSHMRTDELLLPVLGVFQNIYKVFIFAFDTLPIVRVCQRYVSNIVYALTIKTYLSFGAESVVTA
jgi:hypothetical protein